MNPKPKANTGAEKTIFIFSTPLSVMSCPGSKGESSPAQSSVAPGPRDSVTEPSVIEVVLQRNIGIGPVALVAPAAVRKALLSLNVDIAASVEADDPNIRDRSALIRVEFLYGFGLRASGFGLRSESLLDFLEHGYRPPRNLFLVLPNPALAQPGR
ncbi:MAG TPA: hypothetical protein VI457_06850 [Methylococcaceae bacterium]|nr:hypothetical protein [Methylococcaceae bacterium]